MAFVFSEPRWKHTNIKEKLEHETNKNDEKSIQGVHSSNGCLFANNKISNRVSKIVKGSTFVRNFGCDEDFKDRMMVDMNSLSGIDVSKNVYKLEGQKKVDLCCNENINVRDEEKINSVANVNGSLLTEIYSDQTKPAPTKIIEISSLNCSSRKEQYQKSVLDESPNKFQINEDNQIQRSNASIKMTTKENFYIGSKNKELNEKKRKNATREYRKPQSVSNVKRKNRKGSEGEDLIAEKENIEEKFQKKNRVKPISAKHPFHKNEELYKESEIMSECRYDEPSTTLIDSENKYGEFEEEFIENAVPGPGAYEIDSYQDFYGYQKKFPMFKSADFSRFPDCSQNKIGYEFFSYDKPKEKKFVSKASQSKVGFGRSIGSSEKSLQKHKAGKFSNAEDAKNPTFFYENYESIENRTVKAKLKDSINPGFFNSKNPRFPQSLSTAFERSLPKEFDDEEIKELENKFNKDKTTYQFLSNTPKSCLGISQKFNANVEFTGQTNFTIQEKLDRASNTRKYYETEKMPQNCENEIVEKENNRTKTDVEVKYQLIETMKGFRQHECLLKNENESKGYTFQKARKNKGECRLSYNCSTTPSPTVYHHEKEWIKNSFNLRFMKEYVNE